MLKSVYLGNGDGTSHSVDKQLAGIEKWYGHKLDGVNIGTGAVNWLDWSASVGWIADLNKNILQTHHAYWSIPLIPNTGATMADAAKGLYDTKYAEAAKTILAASGGVDPISIRTGWEFNAYWSPHSSSAVGQASNYVGAYQQFVDSFRSVSSRFQFEWTPNIGNDGSIDPVKAYPGDKYVDIISMDFYWDAKQSWSITDPVQAWNWFLNEPNGLNWLVKFAAEHDKPIAIAEWGVNSNNAAPFIALAKQWFVDHHVVYESYWESNAAFSGMLSNGQYPDAAKAFLDAFGYTGPVLPDLPHEAVLSAEANNHVNGTLTAERLTGTDKNDWFDGKAGKVGADTMVGGKGDDHYTVYYNDTYSNRIEQVVEKVGEGIDTVVSWAKSYTLGSNVENLEATSWLYRQTAIGNVVDNRITGGVMDNIIEGKAGNDWLTGGGGKDIFVVAKGDAHDVITDFSADDRVQLNGFGYGFADISTRIFQQGDNTVLFLDANNSITFLHTNVADLHSTNFAFDRMTGNAGNDSYLVISGKEVITESANQGIDTVLSYAASYTLAANVENGTLMLGDWDRQSLTGNALNNRLDAGSNLGSDSLYGGDGNDTLVGGKSADILNGGNGNDRIESGGGADTMTGGTGGDVFVFSASADGARVHVTDFKISEHDVLDLRSLVSVPKGANIDDYVHFIQSGHAVNVMVDMDGVGSHATFKTLVVLDNITAPSTTSSWVDTGSLVT